MAQQVRFLSLLLLGVTILSLFSCAAADTIIMGSRVLKYFAEEKDFIGANKHCRNRGGELFEQNQGDEELSHLNKIAKERGVVQAWLAGTELGHPGYWTWKSTNTAIKSPMWGKGEPNDFAPGQHCLTLSTATGRWDDYYCDKKLPYFCEMRNFMLKSRHDDDSGDE